MSKTKKWNLVFHIDIKFDWIETTRHSNYIAVIDNYESIHSDLVIWRCINRNIIKKILGGSVEIRIPNSISATIKY